MMARPFMELHREMDRLFEDFARSFGMPIPRFADFPAADLMRPTLDIAESDKEYLVKVELPGVAEKDVKVEVVGDALRISGEKRHEADAEEGKYHRTERMYGSFQRILDLPDDADADKIEAAFRDGVMTVKVPRRPAAAARQIEVKAA